MYAQVYGLFTRKKKKKKRQDQTAVGIPNPNWIRVPTESNNVAAHRNYPCGLFPQDPRRLVMWVECTGHAVKIP